MAQAMKEAQTAAEKGEVPVGCVISRGERVLARSHNLRESLKDSTAHCEILAIQQACKELESWRLSDCTIYVTLEPCPMCAGAIVHARLPRLVYGASDPKTGAVDSLFQLTTDQRLNHQVQVASGVMAEESSKLLKKFFANLRKQ